jgi:trans-aconitate methyltransferase
MWNPEDYAKNSDAQLKWAQELRTNLNLQTYKSILDVGCGDGKITADFARTLPESKIVGVDSSNEMITYAQKQYPTSQYPNLNFACLDARQLNFNRQFDLIFSNATLHWVENRQAFLKGANLALQKGGRLIISCGGKGNAAQILQTFSLLIATPSWHSYFNSFQNPYFFDGIEDYQTWLEKYGFTINRLELVSKDMTHEGKEGLAGWIRTTWMPFTQCVPKDKRDDFIKEFVDLYLKKYPLDAEGLTHVSMVRLEVDAVKKMDN